MKRITGDIYWFKLVFQPEPINVRMDYDKYSFRLGKIRSMNEIECFKSCCRSLKWSHHRLSGGRRVIIQLEMSQFDQSLQLLPRYRWCFTRNFHDNNMHINCFVLTMRTQTLFLSLISLILTFRNNNSFLSVSLSIFWTKGKMLIILCCEHFEMTKTKLE